MQYVNQLQNINKRKLKEIADTYMLKVPQLKEHTERCLKTERWLGNITLMIVDAAFMSIGLNYFTAVVPKIAEFKEKFIETRKIESLEDMISISDEVLVTLWRNKRSWHVAKSVSACLVELRRAKELDDRKALIYWAKYSSLNNWENDPIGSIAGVGINTYQYLRMMGGIDTVMPDKIVKRVIAEMLSNVEIPLPSRDIEFIRLVEEIGRKTGYKATELC